MIRQALLIVLPVFMTAQVFITTQAQAFSVSLSSETSGAMVKWRGADFPYELNSRGYSGITDGSDLDTIRKATRSWNNITSCDINFYETGTTTQTATIVINGSSGQDGKNRLVWTEDSSWPFGQMVLGVTSPLFYEETGVIIEADIAFNGYSREWRTDTAGPSSAIDLESVAVHELGHFFGLQHVLGGENFADPPTMAPILDEQDRTRTLTADDEQGARFLYPSGTYSCSSDSDCPATIAGDINGTERYIANADCNSGSCVGFESVHTGGTGIVGSPCTTSNDCKVDYFCQPMSTSAAWCATNCDPANSQTCPTCFTCISYTNDTGGACISDVSLGTAAPGCPSTADPANCSCDTTTACDSNCDCDPECLPCECDLTYDCDPNCDCDPECDDGCGCSVAADTNAAPRGFAFLALAFGLMLLRRRKTSR